MRLYLKCLLVLLIIPVLSFAGSAPTRCPEIGVIQAVGIQKIQYSRYMGFYAAASNDSFATKQKWTFMILGIKAQNDNEAKSKAVDIILRLTKTPKPQQGNKKGEWSCLYAYNQPYVAVALLPAIDLDPVYRRLSNLF